MFIAAAASAGIAISLYPILRKYNEGLALGSVGFRIIEGMLGIVGVICLLLLTTLSQEFVKAGAPNSSYFQTSGVLIVAVRDWVGNVGFAGFLLRCTDVLLYILSNKTRSSMVIRLGSYWDHINHGSRHVSYVPCHRSYVDVPGRFGSSNSRARNGFCGMADS